MTDIMRHSKGIWRSVYYFAPVLEHYIIIEYIEDVLKKLRVDEYSFCHYGNVVSEIPGFSEEAHITFRILFPDEKIYMMFLNEMKKPNNKWKWEDHNYDEALWVKKAYVLGTKLYNMVMEETKNPDVNLNKDFLRLMFHGFFNDAHWGYKQEADFYFYAFKSFLAKFGLSIS